NMMYHKLCDSVPTYDSREHYRLDGPSGAIGGFNQSFPIMDFRDTDMTIDEVAEFEVRTAMQLGIDGFQFFYPLGRPEALSDYNRNIKAFFRAVDRMKVNFKLTVCLCLSEGKMTEAQKIERWGTAMKDLLTEEAWEDVWLKTPDGRHIIYLWIGDGLSDDAYGIGDILKDPSLVQKDAEAYERLAEYCGIEAAYVYHVRQWLFEHSGVMSEILKYYPAFWSFIPLNSENGDNWDSFAKKCKAKGRTYTVSVCPDFYTSKLFRKKTDLLYDRIWRLEDALELGVDGMWRWVFVSGLSSELRASAQRAIEYDVPIINVVTWNDYPEGHQICPDINHNFAFALLLKAYKNIWQGHPERNDRDIGMVFYKKYKANKKPSIADFEVRSEADIPLDEEDYIEAVTILQQPAKVSLNGKNLGEIPAGISVKRIPIETGPVRLKALRGEETVFDFSAPEWITDEPYRTDRFTVGYSSEYAKLWTTIFGNKIPISTVEYAEGKKGLPNWKIGIHLTDEQEGED
ncbi:MAG TPA: endo-1,3-alpha-glucanase family glycosylhydrolase, partial [Pontiella sp.]|nr:endo-1,3-alpha-glucanase family glycosylhydrolase [Pontiella sp.]